MVKGKFNTLPPRVQTSSGDSRKPPRGPKIKRVSLEAPHPNYGGDTSCSSGGSSPNHLSPNVHRRRVSSTGSKPVRSPSPLLHLRVSSLPLVKVTNSPIS
eukprot:sb/3478694/